MWLFLEGGGGGVIVELEVYLFEKNIGDMENVGHIRNIVGLEKKFLGGLCCFIGGKKIPCMCAWSEDATISSEILTTIVETLDILEIFDQSSGIKPFLLRYSHGSMLGLSFLCDLNSPGNI